jgi:outer membrane immunogenic protein
MTKLIGSAAALFALTTLVGAAYAQDIIATQNTPWKGFYVGANIGGLWNHTCSSWEPQAGITGTPALANAFYNRDCPNNGTFIGGVQVGYNFQWEQWVWGFGLDYEAYSAKDHHYAYTYTGPTPPPNGTYAFSGKGSPNGFFLLGPRVGYAVDTFLPYFRIGGVFTSGSHNFTSSFTDANGTATFSGGKDYNSSGFGAGFGVEDQIAQNWSVRAEYTYINLGKGHNTVTTCTGSTATCAEFGNLSLDNIHNNFTANIFRVGINYLF